MTQEQYMKIALKEAQKAFCKSEVPIGAVIVKDGKIISKAHNVRNARHDATAHAEILAIQKACKKFGDWRLEECVLYVTLEPCPMCMGACLNARIAEIVYGADETGSMPPNVLTGVNHSTKVTSGVLAEECAKVLKDYFSQKRKTEVV